MHPLKLHYKAIIASITFLGILGIIAIVLTHISQQHHQFSYKHIASIHTILTQTPPIEAVTIGSSHSDAIDFSVLDQAGEYLNTGGKDMFEAAYTIDQILEEIPSLTAIYMAIPYPTLWVDNAKIRPTLRIQHYYSLPKPFLPCIHLIDSDLINCIKASLLPITRFDNWEGIFVKPASKPTPFKRRSGPENISRDFMINRAEHHLTLVEKGSDDIFINAAYHLEQTIQKVQQYNIDIVFFTPPYHPDYVQIISQQNATMINATHDTMTTLSKKYGVFYEDYNSMDFPTEGFRNADHLNDRGAAVFSSYLKKDLEQYQNKIYQ